jgi:uncharacterized membrane-anchored protein
MTTHRVTGRAGYQAPKLLSKVPEVTIYFWIIKILCTTVGESAADFLNVNLNFGLTGTSVVTGILLAAVLAVQFRAEGYRPVRYWSAVALVSVFGTLVTDNLTDSLGVPLELSTGVFSLALAVVFLIWYRREGTLSIHSIVTRRRESFYWLAILCTFALGTASGDLMSEVLGLGYVTTLVIVAVAIAATALAWRLGAHPVLAFWILYILTRPLGASIGDYLAQPRSAGGLGLGASVTSLVFVVAILVLVTYLAVTRADLIPDAADSPARTAETSGGGLRQTVVAVVLVLVVGLTGYFLRRSAVQAPDPVPGAAPAAGTAAALGDLSEFRVISEDTLLLLDAGRQPAATARVADLETAWDSSEARLKPRDGAAWTDVDTRIDRVLRELRSTSPHVDRERAALTDLLSALS